ncbi:MAG: crotonase/enoyl-CoA hydratase family protein [Gammaproteobacteria bacterium]|nr:crotonase/enoyl-CoA hydratase family protein [Gammaproteobacteria bacterium]
MSNVVQLTDSHAQHKGVGNEGVYSQLKTYYDNEYKIGWFLMDGAPRPCFTPTLLNDLSAYLTNIKAEMAYSSGQKYDYLVVGSNVPGVFNLGGDLNLFRHLIEQRNRDGLLAYAMQCITILYQNMYHFNLDLTTVSMIQGDALGGGFEAALSSNLIIAERGVKLGLPEVLFNLFPGMGAYTLLSRKIGATAAERMILSGKLYSAEEMYEMGVIDILAEPGSGELELYKYIKAARRSPNSYRAMAKVKDISNNVSFQELTDIANVWADAALNITEKDLRMMERLVNRQNSKSH